MGRWTVTAADATSRRSPGDARLVRGASASLALQAEIADARRPDIRLTRLSAMSGSLRR